MHAPRPIVPVLTGSHILLACLLSSLLLGLRVVPHVPLANAIAPLAPPPISQAGLVPNRGQEASHVQFALDLPGARVRFAPRSVELAVPVPAHAAGASGTLWRAIDVEFHGAAPAVLEPDQPTSARVNIIRGASAADWQRNLPTYLALTYRGLYPGIDLRYDVREGGIKATYTVQPDADFSRIRWSYAGARTAQIAHDGAIQVTLPTTPPVVISERPPVAWQDIGATRLAVPVAFVAHADGTFGYQVGRHLRSAPLIIDPDIVFSTYQGGSSSDSHSAVTVDAQNNIYVVGDTQSPGLATSGSLQSLYAGSIDVMVAKYRSSGELVYITYLGGANLDRGYDIVVDEAGSTYITGSAGITSVGQIAFPTTAGAFDRTPNGVDAFVARLSSDGSQLVYSTLYGGGSITAGMAIGLDGAGQAYIAGEVRGNTLPTLNPWQATFGGGINDAFVAKFNDIGSGLIFASYLGGSGTDTNLRGQKMGLHVDRLRAIYVAGETTSTDFPTTDGAYDTTFSGMSDAYVAKVRPDGSGLSYATYLGGATSPEGASSVVVLDGEAFVTGNTSSAEFPTTPDSYQPVKGRAGAAFVTRLNRDGDGLVYSTFYGGGGEFAYDIVIDSGRRAYIAGFAPGAQLPTPGTLQPFGGQGDGFAAAFSADGRQLLFGTYLGGDRPDSAAGVAVDSTGHLIVAGTTRSDNFPVQNAAQDSRSNPADPLATDGTLTRIRTGFGQPGLRAVNSTRGAPRSVFIFVSTGFTPGQSMGVLLNGRVIARVQAGSDGGARWGLRFGALARPGTYTVGLIGSSPDSVATLVSDVAVETTITIDRDGETLVDPGDVPVFSATPVVHLPRLTR